MTRAGHALLLARTVRHLRPAQVVHRARLRAQKQVLHRWPGVPERRWRRPVSGEPGWPLSFAPLLLKMPSDPERAEQIARGTFSFLGHTRSVAAPTDWSRPEASQLWRYNLHYFEWAAALATRGGHASAQDAFLRLWRSWQQGARFGRWDEWSPYVVSVRAWSLAAVFDSLVRGTEIESDVVKSLESHAGFVLRNLELDVGGNHLLKNLKALVGLGVFLGDDDLVDRARGMIEREVGVQVLADGGHFERSPSYHCQVLGDLIDVVGLLRATGREDLDSVDHAIARMRAWLGAMLLPDGDVPLFNDAELVGRPRIVLLEPTPAADETLTVLGDSGYVVARPSSRIHLVADVGQPCPPDLPAHAHADCLSFELCVDGTRLVVDTGTSTYAPGTRRQFERSTAAHNTVGIDGADQTEVWGTFRAARRAVPRLEAASESDGVLVVVASHDGYQRLPGRPLHRRRWEVRAAAVTIEDTVSGAGVHEVVARVHLAPGTSVSRDGRTVRAGPMNISCNQELDLADAMVATAHGHALHATCVVARSKAQLPIRVVTTLDLPDP
ncbi:MAG TPA: alginate lyase family protein [Acidimicrobiales bacterium]